MRARTFLNTGNTISVARRLLLGAVLATGVARALAAAVPVLVESVDSKVADRLMVHRAGRASAERQESAVAHIDIDDATLDLFEGRPPGRAEMASVMRTIGLVGAAAQAYDFVFAGSQGDADARLAEAARDANNVYVGMALDLAGSTAARPSIRTEAGAPIPPIWRIRVEGGPDIPRATRVSAPLGLLQNGVRGIGSLYIAPDADGVVRRLPLLFRYEDGYYPSLALLVACGVLGVTPEHVVLRAGRAITLQGARVPGGQPRDIVIPVDRNAAMLLNFAGDSQTSAFRHYSFGDLWRDGMDPTAAGMWESALSGKVVVVADGATGFADVGAVPVDPRYPLAGLYTTALQNILSASFLRIAPPWVPLAVEAGAIVALWWTAAFWPRWLWPAGALVALLMGAGAAFAFARGRLLPVAEPLLAVAMFTAGAGAFRYFHESREREFTRRTFESYFPPAVVARLVATRQRTVTSQRKELTVLFSDIAGFTPRTASQAPERVQQFLSDYFGRMVAIVFDHGGTVDKFIGDGLMVFFNDPDDQPDHAARCVRCALAMQAAVRRMSEERERVGEPPLLIRIGIHTGEVIVGDLGSPQRLSYTAVGSAVNLAQRLESAAAPGSILLSAATAGRLPPAVSLVPAGAVQLKGFDRPVEVFAATEASGNESGV